jgi:hypothetical protein
MDPAELQKFRADTEAARVFPTTDEVHGALTENPYVPRTGLGQGIETVASLIGPGIIRKGFDHFTRDVVAPYAGGKAGELAGEQLGPEEAEVLSAVGGIGAGPLQEKGKRVVIQSLRGGADREAATRIRSLQDPGVYEPLTAETPNARSERIRRMQQEHGIELTGGQATGNEALKYWEVGPYAGKPAGIADKQNRQLTRAALRELGVDSEVASPEVMASIQDRFGQYYQELINTSGGVVMTPDLENALLDIASRHEDLKGPVKGTVVEKYFNRIVDAAQANGGVIPPDVFNVIHSELAGTIRGASGAPELSVLASTLQEMQDSLYDQIGRDQPEIEAQARDLNNRYRNFKIVQKSVGGAGEAASFGFVSPGKLRAELERRDPTGYSQGRTPLDVLARDAQSITPMPQTGTGARMAGSSLGGMVAAYAPMALASGLTSRPVRTSIVNRASGINPAYFNPMQMPPILNQAVEAGEAPVPVDAAPVGAPPAPQQQGMMDMDFDMPMPIEQTGPLPDLVIKMMQRRGLA